MPKRDGITAARAIREQLPGMKVIALSSTTDNALIASAVLAGVSTYLYKGIKSEQLISIVKGVVAGRVMLLPALVERLLKALPLPKPILQPLLSDEIVLLRLLASQHCDTEIAEQLGVDEATVRSVIERIQTKLAASSRLLAVLRAMQLGLIERTLVG
jgi:DNA-binding NarL/FixJ family response regulator